MDYTQLEKEFPQLSFLKNETLSPYTYMKVGGPADLFVEVLTRNDLFSLVSFCFKNDIDFIVLGGASNVLVPDKGINKLVIRNKSSEITIHEEKGEHVLVTADSGVTTAILANKTMQRSLTGFEYFVGIPGTIGGAIYNNSHFTAHELVGNHITQVSVCTIEGELEIWEKSQLNFAYDYSVFHENKAVILSADFMLFKGDDVHIKEHMLAAAKKRAQSQPVSIPSSGCMFKNPKVSEEKLLDLKNQLAVPDGAIKYMPNGSIQIAAGFLIDKTGLKGKQIGGAQVSEKHATFIVNLGGATAQDVEELTQIVEATVQEKFGIHLEREVFFLS